MTQRLTSIVLLAVALAPASSSAGPLRIIVTPNRAVVAPASVQLFSIEARTADDTVVPGTDIAWSVRPASLGEISADGRFLAAREAGEGLVRVEVRRGEDRGVGYAFVRVGTGSDDRAPFRVSVTPSRTRLAPGGAVTFTATVTGAEGGSAPEWRVVPETSGRIDQSGHFTAGGAAGECRVVAVVRTSTGVGFGQARVLVAPGDARGDLASARLVVLPSHILLQPGDSRSFSVDASAFAGGTLPGSLTWNVEPASLGAVSANGVFIAGSVAGAGVVRASVTAGGRVITGIAAVQIGTGADAAGLRIVPHRLYLRSGDTQQLRVAAQSRRAGMSVDWRVVPENLGRVTPDGLLTAGDPGVGQVVAEIRDERGALLTTSSTSLHVLGALPELAIQSPTLSIGVGESTTLTAALSGTQDLLHDAIVRWVVSPRDLGEFLPSSGVTTQFRGLLPGTGRVVANLFIGDRRVSQASATIVVEPR